MDLRLTGKTVLITGASRGIGRATAEAMADEGCNLVLVARNGPDLELVKGAIAGKTRVRIDSLASDLSQSANIDKLFHAFPDVDVLVNNAGSIPIGELADVDETKWRAAWELKVFGYINMCRRYYARMKARHAGVIVNVVGNAAQTHDPGYICGVAGNAALAAFSQSLGSVSARDGIRVIAVNPGPVATDRLLNVLRRKAHERIGDANKWTELVNALPFGRAAAPEEIGAAIAFLVSDRSSYTSGSVLTIDAGLSARGQSS
jgi:NAD(P)-dependent dehydrogenase (short-subunit alcohol dehydrogenase family)